MKQNLLLLLLSTCLLVACGGGGSGSGGGGGDGVTIPGDNIPAEYVGIYKGTLNVKAEASGISQSGSYPITIIVESNGTITFKDEDSGESFSVGLSNEGNFSGTLSESVDGCSGSINVSGSVNGTTASGNGSGSGECEEGGLTLNINLTSDFNATKQ